MYKLTKQQQKIVELMLAGNDPKSNSRTIMY
jgi:hypothetical protein